VRPEDADEMVEVLGDDRLHEFIIDRDRTREASTGSETTALWSLPPISTLTWSIRPL
jgi:hypothetical protein